MSEDPPNGANRAACHTPASACRYERAALAALCERRRHFAIGYSWGGFESLVMPARIDRMRSATPWTGGPLVRLHVGLEDAADLIADLADGFDAMHRALGER